MSDPRDDYAEHVDPAGTPAEPGPAGIRPHDRVLIVGWVGLFTALVPGLVAVLYLGRPEQWKAREAAVAFGLAGVLTGLYLVAGAVLIVRGLQAQPIQGDAVRYFNLLIIGPFLIVPPVVLLFPLFALLHSGGNFGWVDWTTWATVVPLLPILVLHGPMIVRNRRKIVRGLLAWVDPTLPERAAARPPG
jgi:hypothetical protein